MEQSVSHLCSGVDGGPHLEECRHHTEVATVRCYDQRSVPTLWGEVERANLMIHSDDLYIHVCETVFTMFSLCFWYVDSLISPINFIYLHMCSKDPCKCIWFVHRIKILKCIQANLLFNSSSETGQFFVALYHAHLYHPQDIVFPQWRSHTVYID